MKNTGNEQIVKIASLNGIQIYHLKTEKFKTNSINIFFEDSLSKETAAKNALFPAVLRRGCQRLTTYQDIALYLEELYGANFDCGVSKKGERQIIQFYADVVADKYTGSKDKLFDKTFDLLFEILTTPVVENRTFKKEYVSQEKENLKKLIESRVNDKVQYAVDRCFEEMCKNEPFGIYEYGSVEDIKNISDEELYRHYEHVLKTLPMNVFIAGPVEQDSIEKMINKLSALKRGEIKDIGNTEVFKEVSEVKNITDKMSVSQAKLCLGFRTNVMPVGNEYYTLLVYNGILGGGIHSKLFQNVREKASLAYYAFSRLEKFKGLMVISSGIEIENKDKAYNIISEQLNEIKSGNISDYEFNSTIKSIETGIKSLKDSQLQMVDFYLSQFILNNNDDFESIIENVKKVTKKDVMNISQKIQLDTVYFLTSNQ